MPFAALERPALGLSLLQAELRERGIACDVRYPSFAFADFVGGTEYRWIHGQLPYTAFAGDWSFTPALYGPRADVDAGYVDAILRGTWHLDDESIAQILRIRAYCEHFLDHCLDTIPWSDYDVVGFTSTFEQNVASLALARRVKQQHPDTTIVFGGANWEDEMGQALHRRFPFVDYVCSGEADRSFPELLETLWSGSDPARVPGVVFRRDGETIATGPPVMIRDLDELPYPDYGDFLDALRASTGAADVTPMLLIETSRGCWWGAKQHCTFCGLNGGTMAFRSKSADRALAEIVHLREHYGVDSLSVVDNILDMRYFKTLLPMLVEQNIRMNLFYEVKANLTLDQVRQLGAAGITHIQPGIESMSDRVLRLMRKGTTALQNIQLLKWCREFGVRPEWNLLYGFPGEDPADYREMLPLFDAIDFLDGPTACGPIRLDRFSPYHADPASFGMVGVRPMASYRYLYPFDEDDLLRTAYYFDFDYRDGRDPRSYAGEVIERVGRWSEQGPVGGLWLCPRPDGSAALLDTRSGRREVALLEGWRAAAYLAFDRATTIAHVAEDLGVPPEEVRAFTEWCLERRLMVSRDDRYLALGVHRPPRRAPAEPPAGTDAAMLVGTGPPT
jgi:ribosomal peptide maturation radical SAM protein 1